MKREKTMNPAQYRMYGDKDFGYGGTIVTNGRLDALEFKKEHPAHTVYFEENKKKFEVTLEGKETKVIEVQEFNFTNPIDKEIYG